MIITILCGGSGTRLWPLSRELLPKQFVKLINNSSLFQQTFLRNIPISAHFQIITNEMYYFLAQDEVESISSQIESIDYILESVPKNTAAALLFSALSQKQDEIILALPSDHIIKNDDNYKNAILQANELAKEGKIVLFGITPSSANTGYGYIKDSQNGLKFTEKPTYQKAQEYIKSGDYYWNSGMFCFKASVLIEEFRIHQNDLLNECKKAFLNAKKMQNTLRINPNDMANIKDISIDYAIMEKSNKLELLKTDFEWNDVGSFDALKNEYPKDENNNITNTELIALESKNNFILSNKTIATIGINNLIVVDTVDSLLIAKEGESQKIKEIVKILHSSNNPLCKSHHQVYRPWGSYTILLEGKNYKIKQIIVKPKKRLSLQKHFHRNEHWVVVSGSAVVRIENEEFILKNNESTYIPMGSVHRLENQGRIDLIIIEIQAGEYLGEDDIVRLEDDFNRN